MRCPVAAVVFALVAPACFTELPEVPEDNSASAATGAMTGEVTSGTGGATTTADTDADVPTSEGTTAAPPEGEGIFGCEVPQPCEVWTLPDCSGACTLDDAGACVLEQLRLRETAGLRVRSCDGPCTLDALLVRGGGAAELRRQRASVGADEVLKNYQAPTECALEAEAFFAACLEAFTPACADPDLWALDCGPVGAAVCG